MIPGPRFTFTIMIPFNSFILNNTIYRQMLFRSHKLINATPIYKVQLFCRKYRITVKILINKIITIKRPCYYGITRIFFIRILKSGAGTFIQITVKQLLDQTTNRFYLSLIFTMFFIISRNFLSKIQLNSGFSRFSGCHINMKIRVRFTKPRQPRIRIQRTLVNRFKIHVCIIFLIEIKYHFLKSVPFGSTKITVYLFNKTLNFMLFMKFQLKIIYTFSWYNTPSKQIVQKLCKRLIFSRKTNRNQSCFRKYHFFCWHQKFSITFHKSCQISPLVFFVFNVQIIASALKNKTSRYCMLINTNTALVSNNFRNKGFFTLIICFFIFCVFLSFFYLYHNYQNLQQ